MTLTATSGSGTGFGHLKAFRTGAPAPSAALMGWDNGDFEPVTTSAIIRPGNEGDVTIQNTSDGPVTISISAQGWFAAVPIIAPDMQQDFVETAAYAGLSSDFANQAIYDNEMASQILKPPAPEDVPMPADVPTESSDPAPQDQGAATVDGYFKTYGGDPVPNMTVHLGVAGSAPEDGSEEPVPVVGTAVTDDAGKWTYTMPVPLPPSLQAYADANGGVLNVVATVSGTEPDGTPAIGQQFFPVGVATGDGTTATSEAVRAEQAPETATVLPDTMQTGTSASLEAPSDAALADSWAAQQDVTDDGLGGTADDNAPTWQSPSGEVPSSYNPAMVGGIDYSHAVPRDQICTVSHKTVSTRVAKTTVAEWHAYWNAKGWVDYSDSLSTSIGVGLSVNGSDYHLQGGTTLGSGTGGDIVSAPRRMAAHTLRLPIKYAKVKYTTTCQPGNQRRVSYAVEALGYHKLNATEADLYFNGRNVLSKDGGDRFSIRPRQGGL